MLLGRKKRVIAGLVVLFTLVMPLSAAWGSSYTGTLFFKRTFEGKVEKYDGKSIACYVKDAKSLSPGPFFVRPYKYVGPVAVAVGEWKPYRCIGSTTATWPNVRSGSYSFHFVKADDGRYVRSDYVRTFNY